MEFGAKTRAQLLEAGWSTSRRIDTSAYVTALTELGYSVNGPALGFLANFGGLVVNHPHRKVAGIVDRFHLDPVRASGHTHPDNLQIYGSRVGESLTLVGEAFRGNMLLMMGSSGKLYAAIDEFLVLVGSDVVAALTVICEGQDWQAVIE